MNWLDFSIIGIVLLSALLGWWRGLVIEALSLMGWVAAYVVARMFAASVEPMMPASLGAEAIRMAAAFGLLFVATLVAASLTARALSKAVKWVGLGWMDDWMGALFGVVRGMFVVLVVVLLIGLTSLPKEAFWRESWLHQPLEKVALMAKDYLPGTTGQQISYQN